MFAVVDENRLSRNMDRFINKYVYRTFLFLASGGKMREIAWMLDYRLHYEN